MFHARTKAESWGGTLVITSELGKGTTVTIKLPKAEAPAGFVPMLELTSGKPVVVLDDDSTIHQVWQGPGRQGVSGDRIPYLLPQALRGLAGQPFDLAQSRPLDLAQGRQCDRLSSAQASL